AGRAGSARPECRRRTWTWSPPPPPGARWPRACSRRGPAVPSPTRRWPRVAGWPRGRWRGSEPGPATIDWSVKRGAKMPEAVIVDAIRTPIGRAVKGSLKDVRADDLAAVPLRALVERNPQVNFAETNDV